MLKFCDIAMLSFSESLVRVAKVFNRAKSVSLNNKTCLARPTLIDLNSKELHYYPFIVSLQI